MFDRGFVALKEFARSRRYRSPNARGRRTIPLLNQILSSSGLNSSARSQRSRESKKTLHISQGQSPTSPDIRNKGPVFDQTIKKGIREFKVSDTGPGIASEELGTLFDPFVQTETGRKSQSGTGLGLPISQKFIELMSGEIGVTSQPGRGTTFTFDIQMRRDLPQESQTQEPTRKVIGLAPDHPKYRLLVWMMSKSAPAASKMLGGLEFEVREAENGQEAIALWSTWEPHLSGVVKTRRSFLGHPSCCIPL
ncbi:MAG: hypothetical protein EBE86_002960 [Hormoscilla sp. GUM202]|nr:hypothetical protein [Hormoscilla sp. GUM202]